MIQSLFLVRMRRRGLRKKRDAALRIQASFRGKRARDALRVCQAQSGDGTDAEADETSDYGRGGREANRGRGEDEPSTNSTTGDEARTTISRWRPHETSTNLPQQGTTISRWRPVDGRKAVPLVLACIHFRIPFESGGRVAMIRKATCWTTRTRMGRVCLALRAAPPGFAPRRRKFTHRSASYRAS